MPELPEVQTIVDDLAIAGICGQFIWEVVVLWPRSIATPVDFSARLAGDSIRNIERRGKYIIIKLGSGRALLIHLRMSGRILLYPSQEPVLRHEHVLIKLQDGRDLRLHDTRKFGRMYLVDNQDDILGSLGLEPLGNDFTIFALEQIVSTRARMLKPLLLDQRLIAGLGNIYVDEALWEAGLHPQRISKMLQKKEIVRLHRAIQAVLQRGLRNRGTSLGNSKTNFTSLEHRPGSNAESLNVFRRNGKPCPHCGASIIRLVVGQRGTHICPQCQPL